jgi:hypothetical protein
MRQLKYGFAWTYCVSKGSAQLIYAHPVSINQLATKDIKGILVMLPWIGKIKNC